MASGERPFTKQSLNEIALEVGFQDLKAFERAAEKYIGRKPLA
jgi:AraC-like DNA-binding protein